VFVPPEEQQCIPEADKAAATDNAARNMFGSEDQVCKDTKGTEEICAEGTSDTNPICGILDHDKGVCKEEDEEDPGFWGTITGALEGDSKDDDSGGGGSTGKTGDKKDADGDVVVEMKDAKDDVNGDDDSGIEYTITFTAAGAGDAADDSGGDSLGAGAPEVEYQAPADDIPQDIPQAAPEAKAVELTPEPQDDQISGHYLNEVAVEQAKDLHAASHSPDKKVATPAIIPGSHEPFVRGAKRVMCAGTLEGGMEDVVGGALAACEHEKVDPKVSMSRLEAEDGSYQGDEGPLFTAAGIRKVGRGRARAILSMSAPKRTRASLAVMFGFSGDEGDDLFSIDEEARKQGGLPPMLFSFVQAGLGLAAREADAALHTIAHAGGKRYQGDENGEHKGRDDDQPQDDEDDDGEIGAPKKTRPHTVGSVAGYYA